MNQDIFAKQDYLREDVRTMSKKLGLKFDFFSNKLNMKIRSFYNFMAKQKNLSNWREEKLKETIERLKSNGL